MPGQHFEDAAMCTAAVPLWTPTSPQQGWLTCASVPTPLEQWPLCAGRRRAVSWSATAAGTRAVPPSPHRPVASLAHICCKPAAHTVQPCHSLPGTQSRSEQHLCSGAAVHTALCTAQAALSSTSAHRDDSLSSRDLPGSLH
ncbi:Major surface-labeled trophozoite antigen precursor [Giardia duodenalis]|uniref:Major surface-labeled trophozoite antigen n=1 Tax=Giardia intestinalis TaxID=5741 RepID=V6TY01_GIAIN|nr:Major surface-labeled trophozoite antigen precursor [Giardia intestinalis]